MPCLTTRRHFLFPFDMYPFVLLGDEAIKLKKTLKKIVQEHFANTGRKSLLKKVSFCQKYITLVHVHVYLIFTQEGLMHAVHQNCCSTCLQLGLHTQF